MKQAEFFAILYFGGFALVAGLFAVLAQSVFFDVSTRFGRRVLPLIPVMAWLAMTLTIALSNRNLNVLLPGADQVGDGGSAWFNRLANAGALALAFAKIVEVVFAPNKRKLVLEKSSHEQIANRNLFISFVAFFICSVLMPMIFAQKPGFTHNGIPALMVFIAVYLARYEDPAPMIAGAKWTLFIILTASLGAAAVLPRLAVETRYLTGWIPGLHYRLWGLASHANAMSALGIYLAILLVLQPARSKLLNTACWLVTIAVVVLAQSKTTWLACLIVGLFLLGYRKGRDSAGRIRPGFLTILILGAAILLSSILFIDAPRVISKFLESDTGASLSTLTGRTRVWEAALDLWMQYPAFGYGLEAWSPEHRIQLGVPFATHAHNQLLQAMSVGGSFSAVSLIIYFVLLTRGALRAAQRTQGVSLALMLVFALRCLSEAPLDLGNVASGETIAQLLLFMLIVHRPDSRTATVAVKRHFQFGRGALSKYKAVG